MRNFHFIVILMDLKERVIQILHEGQKPFILPELLEKAGLKEAESEELQKLLKEIEAEGSM